MVTVLGAYWVGAWAVHGTSAVLVRDGKVVSAVSEERVTRLKHDARPPVNAIKEVLRISGLHPSTIDAVAVPFESPAKGLLRSIWGLASPSRDSVQDFVGALVHYPYSYGSAVAALRNYLGRIGVEAPIRFVNHHSCHAASSFFMSGLNRATVLTMDGAGDYESSTVWRATEEGLRRLAWSSSTHSLGTLYAELTVALGFRLNDGEGKVMGLAAYGDPSRVGDGFPSLLEVEGLRVQGKRQSHTTEIAVDYKDGKEYAPYRYMRYKNNLYAETVRRFKAEDVASAGQAWLENTAATLAKNAVSAVGEANICLAGGVAFNVKVNKRIREAEGVGEVFVQPAAGDEGSALGAALIVCRELMLDKGQRMPQATMEHVYFGTTYASDEVEKRIADRGLRWEKVSNPGKAGADLITEGKVIGWFQGSMEFGPRALGNRSVLADPRSDEVRERINSRLKRREWFMPFAPSILDEAKGEYLVNPVEAPFMIMAFDAVESRRREVPTVVHVDGTPRPQTVKRSVNPRFWELIKQFEENTGIPLVLNTSFNRHGLPIVMSPDDALDHLMWGCVDACVLEDRLVYRQFS